MSAYSSSATTSGSRSPSPHTPASSDSVDQVVIHSELPAWYSGSSSVSPDPAWVSSPPYREQLKSEDTAMLQLDDLIEQHAYEDVSSPSPSESHNPFSPSDIKFPDVTLPHIVSNNSRLPSMPTSVKPIPPPALFPRKQGLQVKSQKVVYPPKESCYNLPIMFPSLPENGAKSRVETQTRVTIELADPSSSTDVSTYDRIGSWKWLKLPQGTATKRRTRKQGKIDPDPQDMLYLTASVSCASPPHSRVLSCSSCQAREAKRVAKKIAARVRPSRSDSDTHEDPNGLAKSKQLEDTTSIIQFNCAEVIDFSTGSAVLPLRITCYCRHHREKVGFNVNLAMMDHQGRIVGTGSSKPIMITDDHKTATNGQLRHGDFPPIIPGGVEYDMSQVGAPSPSEVKAPSKRKKDITTNNAGKRRAKPYDASAKPSKGSRETSVSSSSSPAPPQSPLPSDAPLPSTADSVPDSTFQSEPPSLHYVSQDSESSPDGLITPVDINPDISMFPEASDIAGMFFPSQLSSQTASGGSSSGITAPSPSMLPFMFSAPQQQSLSAAPTIHRLIPNCGPTHGGIEVTVLGANFHPSIQLNCVFGDMPASSTQRWSDNTLVCVLPPRATAGVVAVWFEGFPKLDDQMNNPPSLFTYSDESDRALMELALQVVGLKMTGKIEDAKNVAMRIVGAGEGSDSGQSGNGQDSMMQLASASSLRPLLLIRAGESEDFESLIVNFLKLMDTSLDHPSAQMVAISDAISHPTKSGQTLLHLAAILGYTSLIEFLVTHHVDLDARDRNGYTALHFASMIGSIECAKNLLRAGADPAIVNALGKTPEEIGTLSFDDILEQSSEAEADDQMVGSSDEEAEWGDAEEDAADVVFRRAAKGQRGQRLNRRSDAATEELGQTNSRTSKPPGEAKEKEMVDEKHVPSFIDMVQRTVAQLPGAPHLGNLPLLPGVPWEALQQLPMAFPVAVPILPGWLSGLHGSGQYDADDSGVDKVAGPMKGVQEWKAFWEKWLALAPWQATEMVAPPQYTPRASQPEAPIVDSELNGRISSSSNEEETDETAHAPAAGSRIQQESRRRYHYNTRPVTDQEVNAYAYQPKSQQKKHDRMLLLFWLPILMISLLWAFHNGLLFVVRTIKSPTAFKKVFGY